MAEQVNPGPLGHPQPASDACPVGPGLLRGTGHFRVASHALAARADACDDHAGAGAVCGYGTGDVTRGSPAVQVSRGPRPLPLTSAIAVGLLCAGLAAVIALGSVSLVVPYGAGAPTRIA